MKKQLFLLDAFALIYRSYFALLKSPRQTSYGKNTNAQFGFSNTLSEIINTYKPSHIAVVFDTADPTERHEKFDAYKANRDETPDDILQAIPDIKTILDGFNICRIEKAGFEADDIIATIATKYSKEVDEVYMVTPDKDYGQVVSENIYILKPPVFKSGYQKLGKKEICEKWNIKDVSQVIDYLAIVGDSADNIPGIKGIGPKGAEQLLKAHNTLEAIYENMESVPPSIQKKLNANREMAFLSKELVEINTNVPLENGLKDIEYKEIDRGKLKKIFDELEFRTLSKRVLGAKDNSEQIGQMSMFGDSNSPKEENSFKTYSKSEKDYKLIQTKDEIQALVKTISDSQEICIDTETTGLDVKVIDLVGMSIAVKKNEAYYIKMSNSREENRNILSFFEPLFEDDTKIWVGQNIKYDASLLMWHGFTIRGKMFDTMILQYVLNPNSKKGMDFLSKKYLNYLPISITSLIGEKGKKQLSMRNVPLEQIAIYAAEDADITLQLRHVLEKAIDSDELKHLFYNIEMPLTKVLMDTEYNGFKIDVDFLKSFSAKLQDAINQLGEKIIKWLGEEINLLSPKQLGELLFDKKKIVNKPRKTKTGQYATDELYLQKLSKNIPELLDIIEYRELCKLKSTYVDALPNMVNPNTNKVHTTFSQSLAVTGRLSSYSPNLQNIPIKTPLGQEIRKSFIASSANHHILAADYSQIELRILAFFSSDETLTQAFKNGVDIHSSTASKIFAVPIDKVTKEMRYKAKSVNFGIIYGQSAYGLSETAGIPINEAKEIIDNYFKLFSSVKGFMDDQIRSVQQLGYAKTMLGRRRYLNDINAQNSVVRGYAERNAINMPIQGTAADMIKIAMINIHHRFNQENIESKMILQVHDELIFDVLKDETDKVQNIVEYEMKNALALGDVPVEVETGIGENWLQAH